MRPAAVGATPRGWRSIRARPVSRSRRLTCWLTADWVQDRVRATALRLPVSYTVMNTRRSSSVTSPRYLYDLCEKIQELTWASLRSHDGVSGQESHVPGCQRQPVPRCQTGAT